MFTTEPFYHDLIRKYTIVFGTLFNKMQIKRYTTNGGTAFQTVDIPLAYGPREKFLAQITQNPDGVREVAIKLPRMSFEITDINPDSQRRLPKHKMLVEIVDDKAKRMYRGSPVDINFQLSIITKSTEDGTKIIEQILPYFDPDWTVSAFLIKDMPTKSFDIPIILNNVTSEDVYEGDFLQRRAITWMLDFTMKAYMFGPVKEQGQIKKITVDMWDRPDMTDFLTGVEITPGLTSNGEPTTIKADSIPYQEIEAGDNYGIVEEHKTHE